MEFFFGIAIIVFGIWLVWISVLGPFIRYFSGRGLPSEYSNVDTSDGAQVIRVSLFIGIAIFFAILGLLGWE